MIIAQSFLAPAALACALSSADAAYVQSALDGWTTIARDLLRIPAQDLPWMVLYTRDCAYHLAPDATLPLGREGRALDVRLTYAGRPVVVRAIPSKDGVRLPDGASLPVAGVAYTSVYGPEGREKAYFVTALPDVWKQDPKYRDDPEDWPPFVLEVLSHELVHTRQMVAIMKRLEELKQRLPAIPSTVNDDWLQKQFEPVPGVGATVRAEVELLHQAAADPDAERGRALARTALGLMRARRATYYGEKDAAYSAMEDVFLNMEGVACWSAFQLARTRDPGTPAARVLERFRGNRKFWSQEEGLALFLALDRFEPAWRARVFPPELASPVELLAAAVAEEPRASPGAASPPSR
jgi:hypothetical protein